MTSEIRYFPRASAKEPIDILFLLIRQTPRFIIPAGPYFNFKSPDSRPQSTYEVEYFEGVLAEVRHGMGAELTVTAANVLRYVIAGLIKHNGLFTFCDDFEGDADLQRGCETLTDDADAILAELYEGKTVTDAQLRWIKSEQAQTIRVVNSYPEVLEATCRANEKVFDLASSLARSSEKTDQARVNEVRWLLYKVRQIYIDLGAVGRVRSGTLNTVRPEYQTFREQDKLYHDLLEFLESLLHSEPSEPGPN
ncbi:hypothetical protein MMC34_005935 [Xylographa carneopallida]|nr:hypothetical protein [Xylographa carneopallida]